MMGTPGSSCKGLGCVRPLHEHAASRNGMERRVYLNFMWRDFHRHFFSFFSICTFPIGMGKTQNIFHNVTGRRAFVLVAAAFCFPPSWRWSWRPKGWWDFLLLGSVDGNIEPSWRKEQTFHSPTVKELSARSSRLSGFLWFHRWWGQSGWFTAYKCCVGRSCKILLLCHTLHRGRCFVVR